MNLDLSKIKKVFFVGIGGIGISALARMALSQGVMVSGLNDEEGGKTLETLEQDGIKVVLKKDFKKLPDADLYVYSDAWDFRGPEIINEAKKTGKPVLTYFEALGQFARGYKVIAIAGTHGKTTTTAMVANILIDAGFDPTCIIGSFVPTFGRGSATSRDKNGSNFRSGSSKYLVVEADEYNRHFLNFHPFITVITNIEPDHLDYYKDIADIRTAFGELISQTSDTVIYNGGDSDISVLVHGYNGKTVDYSKYLDKVPRLSVPGEHNKINAAAALVVADALGVALDVAQKSLAGFSGTWRRLEKKGETEEGTIVYDDYAHHPTEIKASLQALRELYPKNKKNITILFQPHLYSRTKALFDDFAKSFSQADRILLLPIYFAREIKDENISSEKLAEAITEQGDNAQAFSSFELAETFLKSLDWGSKDVFVTMGAGEAYKVADKMFDLTNNKNIV